MRHALHDPPRSPVAGSLSSAISGRTSVTRSEAMRPQASVHPTSASDAAVTAELQAIPEMIESALATWHSQASLLAARYQTAASFLFLGRGVHYAIAREGALKLKEASYVHAEGYPVGELKHGPNALVSEQVPLVVIATVDRALEASIVRYEKTITAARC